MGTHTYSLHTNPGDLGPLAHSLLPLHPIAGVVWHHAQASQGLVAVEYYLLLFCGHWVEKSGVIARGNPPSWPGSQLEAL